MNSAHGAHFTDEKQADASTQYSLELSWPLNGTCRLVLRSDKRVHAAFHLGAPG